MSSSARIRLLWPLLLLALALAPATAFAGDHAAPDFTVRTLEGKHLKLSDLKGHPVVLDFWATWCTPCRASMPHLDALQKRYANKGLVVVGLSMDELSPKAVRSFVDHLGIGFRMAMANDRMLTDYGPIRAIPTTFIIDREGHIARRVVGYVDEDTMDRFIREVL